MAVEMELDEFLAEINDNVRGTDDDAPALSTDDAKYWIRIYNRKKSELYRDTTKNWDATWAVISLGTVIAATTPSYAFSDSYTIEGLAGWRFLRPSDHAYIEQLDGNVKEFEFIKPRERDNSQKVFVSGVKTPTLYFSQPIVSTDNFVGGELFVAGYFLPPNIDQETTDATLPILLPDPHWGAMAVAAEVAFNDLTYEDKAPDLNAKANNLFQLMTLNNRSGTYDSSRKSRDPAGKNRIRGYR